MLVEKFVPRGVGFGEGGIRGRFEFGSERFVGLARRLEIGGDFFWRGICKTGVRVKFDCSEALIENVLEVEFARHELSGGAAGVQQSS